MSPDEQKIVDELNSATTTVATRIQSLLNATPGLSADFVAAMTKETDALNALGTPTPTGGVTTTV